ncbi:MAG TPA: hypothetical protein VGR63_01605 [Casimicrobiaceae bacterium]|nr:hypothetical protein [Casimicrobiaceae bacterium]
MASDGNDRYFYLWFFAAALALAAAGITYFRSGEFEATAIGLAIFGVAMGYMGWAKRRKPPA